MTRSSGSNARHSRTPRLRFCRCLRQKTLVPRLLPNSESRKTDCERRVQSSGASKREHPQQAPMTQIIRKRSRAAGRSSRQEQQAGAAGRSSRQEQERRYLLLLAAPAYCLFGNLRNRRNLWMDLLVEVGQGNRYYCEKGPDAYADTDGDVPRGRVAFIAFNLSDVAVADRGWRVSFPIAQHEVIIPSLGDVALRFLAMP